MNFHKGQNGFCVFFTGLSGSGKTTLATALDAAIQGQFQRRTTLLDGDVVRTHLSSELGFSREHRDVNIRRIGFVAAEVVKHGGVAIAAAIAPYDAARQAARAQVAVFGRFYLVHLSTSLAVCEARDVKGLYARARAGVVPAFTGVSDPYEVPVEAELVIDTATVSLAEALGMVIARLQRDGVLP
ncbi:MAG: adenylyl-sulfate kinase [Betaproteobacteria bacterium]|nr:adenylyl-sulfate kinase [Betaproteobacteria bacterium]